MSYTEDQKDQSNNLDDLYEKIDIEELSTLELNEEETKFLEAFTADPGFQMSLEQLLSEVENLDITQIQSKLLLLMRQFFHARIKDKEVLKSLIKKREKVINDHLKHLSLYIMQNRSQIIRDASRGIAKSKDKYEYLSKKSRENLKQIIKRFAVYELYKFVNPRRIAGETRRENFIHNMVLGGMERASRFEGGTKAEIKSYSPQFIKNLEKQHKEFAKGGGKGRGFIL
jgi:hypothetical protein